MIVVTTPSIPGYRVVKIIGPVYGLSIRTRGFWGKLVASIESFLGGEIKSFIEECEKARLQSIKIMIERAEKLGANAIIGVDFDTSDVLGTATIFTAYGTAVVVEKITKAEEQESGE